MNSVPRKVNLRDGMIETIDCQSHTLNPNKTGDSINNAVLTIGYGDTVTSMNDVPELDKKGRFLTIDCERLN